MKMAFATYLQVLILGFLIAANFGEISSSENGQLTQDNKEYSSVRIITGTASPLLPFIYRFNFSNNNSEVAFIKVSSSSSICTLISVEQPLDIILEEDTGAPRLFETFTNQTGLTVSRDDFPRGFKLVFTPFANDSKCTSVDYEHHSEDVRVKTFEFSIQEGGRVLEGILAFLLLVPLLHFIHLIFSIGIMNRSEKRRLGHASGINKFPDLNRLRVGANINLPGESASPVSISSNFYKYFFLHIFVSIAINCVLKVMYQEKSEIGDLDVCYRNTLCSVHLWGQDNFNNLYSNISYVMSGLKFGIMVRYQQTWRTFATEMPGGWEFFKRFFGFGVPQMEIDLRNGVYLQDDLFYCKSMSICLQGCMSAFYHRCPSQFNFFYDICFMYTIAILSILIVCQFRHPTCFKPYVPFVYLTIVGIISEFGLFVNEFLGKVVFIALYTGVMISMVPFYINIGYVTRNGRVVNGWWEMMSIFMKRIMYDIKRHGLCQGITWRWTWLDENGFFTQVQPRPYPFWFPVCSLLVYALSVTIVLCGSILSINFGMQVVIVHVINGIFFPSFYLGMKWWYNEFFRANYLQPCFHLASGLIFWSLAVYSFLFKTTAFEVTAAESRVNNRECLIGGVFDWHDAWHFFGAQGLYCIAMFVLTVDNNMFDQPKSEIPIF